MWFLILLLIVVLIGLLYFISWFVNYRKAENALCARKNGRSTKAYYQYR